MVNHFRSLLLNLEDTGEPLDHLAAGFAPRELSSAAASFHGILFPVSYSRAERLVAAHAYLELLHGTGFADATTAQDDRITYDLAEDFNHFKSTGLDCTGLVAAVEDAGVAETLFSVSSEVDASKYDNTWRLHKNASYRLAGVIASHVLRLE